MKVFVTGSSSHFAAALLPKLCAQPEIEFPGCIRLRPHLILGPNARPAFKRLFSLPCYVRMPEPHPLLQCVHEDDAAQHAQRSLRARPNLKCVNRGQ